MLVVDSTELEDTGDPDEFRDHQLIGLAVADHGRRAGRQGRRRPAPRPGPAGRRGRRAAGRGGDPDPVRDRRSCPRSTWPAGRLVIDPPPGLLDPERRPALGGRHRRADRHHHHLPASTSRRCTSRSSARPCQRGDITFGVHDLRGLGHRRAPHRGRLAVRRRARHGHEARALGRGARRDRARGRAADPAADRAHPGRGPVHPGMAAQYAARALAGLRLRPVRGHRRAGRRGRPDPDGRGRGQHRRLRAARRRAGGAGHGRGSLPPAARRARQRRSRRADDSFGGGDAARWPAWSRGPSYTRPRVWRGREVPPVLLSGDHAAIARWRRDWRPAPHRRRTAPTWCNAWSPGP